MTPYPVLIAAAIFAAGCGGSASGPATDAPQPEQTTPVVAALGDSITAGNPLYDPDPAQRASLGFGADPRSQYGFWAERENPELDVANCGVFGERTDEIAARLRGCTEGADALIVQGGINDIAQALARGPRARASAVSEAAANIDGMLAQAEDLELDVALANVLPWNNGHPQADAPIAKLNGALAAIAKRRGVPLLDFHAALEDPSEPGIMRLEYTQDGDHPSIEGYRVLGSLVAREFE